MRTTLLLLFAALSSPLVVPCAVAEESPWVVDLGTGAGDDAETRGLLDFLESLAAQQVVFPVQQNAAKLTLAAAGMTVQADKNTVTGEGGAAVHNMRLAIGPVQGSIAERQGYAYFFPLKEEDKVTDDFFELATGWVEAHVPATSAPHVLIEFESPRGGLIYVFFESAEDGGSAKIRKIFYVSPEDLEWS